MCPQTGCVRLSNSYLRFLVRNREGIGPDPGTGAASSELLTWKGCAWVSIIMLGHVPAGPWCNLQEPNLPRPNHDEPSPEDPSESDRLEAGRRATDGRRRSQAPE